MTNGHRCTLKELLTLLCCHRVVDTYTFLNKNTLTKFFFVAGFHTVLPCCFEEMMTINVKVCSGFQTVLPCSFEEIIKIDVKVCSCQQFHHFYLETMV